MKFFYEIKDFIKKELNANKIDHKIIENYHLKTLVATIAFFNDKQHIRNQSQ